MAGNMLGQNFTKLSLAKKTWQLQDDIYTEKWEDAEHFGLLKAVLEVWKEFG